MTRLAVNPDETFALLDYAINRSQPEPGALARSLVLKKGSKIWAWSSSSIPAPVSLIASNTYSPAGTRTCSRE